MRFGVRDQGGHKGRPCDGGRKGGKHAELVVVEAEIWELLL